MMTTRNDDGGDDGDDDDRPIRTATACGGNRIRMNSYRTWILLWLVMGQIVIPYKIKDNCKNAIHSEQFMGLAHARRPFFPLRQTENTFFSCYC